MRKARRREAKGAIHLDIVVFFSLSFFYGVKIMRLWSPRCAQWNGTIFEPPRSCARALPTPCRLRSSIARQICSESTFAVPNTATSDCVPRSGTGVKERDGRYAVCARVYAALCSSARRRIERITTTTRRSRFEEPCVMRIKTTVFLGIYHYSTLFRITRAATLRKLIVNIFL